MRIKLTIHIEDYQPRAVDAYHHARLRRTRGILDHLESGAACGIM
jgi:hypothetical protein